MLHQLGSMPFSEEYLTEDTVGHWVIENDPGKKPRMYVDDIMLGLIGLTEQTDPESTFDAWFAGIDPKYLDSVMETERMNVSGIRAEVQYPWHYPDGHTILIRCEGIRNFAYENGIRTEGRHRNITDLTHLQKESAVISALASDFECVNYIILNGSREKDITIPFRTSSRIKAMIPNWEQETSFHNRLKLLIDYFGYTDDVHKFYLQTRRDVILRHLEQDSSYYVNARFFIKEESAEYFQFKFMADRDSDGRIVGIIVGIHSVDDEMRQEMELRKQVEQLVEEKTEELKNKNEALAKVNERIISLVGEIVESRDEECGQHISRVTYLTRILGLQVMKDLPEYNLTVEDVSAIASVSPLHDVGKIKIPDQILLKPGKLTSEEFEVLKTHCDKGCDILRGLSGGWSEKLFKLSMDICRYHHEKWDGKGYPCGLKGDEIPIAAQIVSLADVYDALVSERCYKKAYSHEQAYRMILDGKCGKYSDKLLSCLSKCRKAFKESSAYIVSCGDAADIARHPAGSDYISDAVPLIEEISQSMPGGFFIYQADEDEKLIYFNDIMVEYLGCTSREEFMEYTGNSFKGIVHQDDYASVKREIGSQISQTEGRMDHVAYRIVKTDGAVRWLDDYGRLIRSGDMGNVFFVFVIDFTETYLRRTGQVIDTKSVAPARSDTSKAVFHNLKVLVVDDSEIARALSRELLEEEGAIVTEAEDGLKAVNAVRESPDFDLVLMDIVMPVMSGISAIREIKPIFDAAGKQATIICLTAEGSDTQIKEALAAGAYECLYKPLNVTELSRHVIESMRKNSQRLEKQIVDTIRIANTDTLTNVYSIAAFTDKVAELSANMAADPNIQFGIVVCDCDRLKYVNDTYGHDVGDQYIRNTSSAISSVFANSPIFRIGGDEFVIILLDEDYRNVNRLMKELRFKSGNSCDLDAIRGGCTQFSFGTALYDRNIDESVGAVIKRADVEMYRTKEKKNSRK